jgi:hypothetical protein
MSGPVTSKQIQELAAQIVKVLWPIPLYSLQSPDDERVRQEREQMIVSLITAVLAR